jgi:hypothetical protein
MRFNYEKFDKWGEETKIPESVMKMVKAVSNELGLYLDEDCVEVLYLQNIYGENYACAKGFRLTHCTSSLSDGPSHDYSKDFMKWLQGVGFVEWDSYGDNGMDSATNWRDTYWTTELAYEPTKTYFEAFYDFNDEDEDEF